jgi:hypothetical protein
MGFEQPVPSVQPQLNWVTLEDPIPIEEEILDAEDLIFIMESLKKSIERVPEVHQKIFRNSVPWGEHVKGYTLLRLLRSTICHVGKENIDLKKKIKRLDNKVTAQKILNRARREKKRSLRSGKN